METLRAWAGGLKQALVDLLHWTQGFADSPHGAAALFAIAFAESSFFPIPPDVLLVPLCLGQPRLAFWFAAVCTAGSVLGGIAGYGIGRYGGRPLLRRLIKPRRIAAVESYYDRYNAWATGIAGLTPIPYKVFTIAGGAFAVGFRVFVLASVVGRGLRFFGLATLIYFFGAPIQRFIERYLDWLTLAFAILLVGGFLLAGRGLGRAGRGGGEPGDGDDDEHGRRRREAGAEAAGER
jgi:membrane protein YqaA with SNARE-associated domain